MGSDWLKKVCHPCSSIQIEYDETVIQDERTPLIRPSDSIDFGYFLLGILLTFLFVGASIGTYLLFREDNLTLSDLDNLVLREDWSNVEPSESVRLITKPITKIQLVEIYNSTCTDIKSCEETIRNFLKDNITNGTDFNYSYFIGGDGRIYEGLGWYRTKSSNMTTTTIALLGSFSDYEPTFDQKETLKKLLHGAMETRILSDCYSVIISYDREEIFDNIRNLGVELQKERNNDCDPSNLEEN